jgi:uncharacterized protein
MNARNILKISLKSIPDTGKDLVLDLEPEWFASWREEDPRLEFSQATIHGALHLSKHHKDILVRGHLTGELSLACSRCLEPFVTPVETDFDLLLVPRPSAADAEEEELAPQDLDQDFYVGDTLDLEAIIREQIILMVPLKPLCQEACKGLCPTCGANLNQESCSCTAEKSPSPFAPLAKLKG